MNMKIKVTREHIEMGHKRITNKCPIALAIKDYLWGHCLESEDADFFIEVTGETAVVVNHVFKLPDRAQAFIDRFDRPGSKPSRFRAFTFNLRPLSTSASREEK